MLQAAGGAACILMPPTRGGLVVELEAGCGHVGSKLEVPLSLLALHAACHHTQSNRACGRAGVGRCELHASTSPAPARPVAACLAAPTRPFCPQQQGLTRVEAPQVLQHGADAAALQVADIREVPAHSTRQAGGAV